MTMEDNNHTEHVKPHAQQTTIHERIPARLVLEDGTVFHGWSFGACSASPGEVVFNTAMAGYPESITDPSHHGQILALTYPLIGNYGVPGRQREHGMLRYFESDHIHIRGLVVSDHSPGYSHWNADRSLSDWLSESGVPGMSGVDTRALTRHLREHGTMAGAIVAGDATMPALPTGAGHPVSEVSTREVVRHGSGRLRVLLVDCGVKNTIIRCLLRRGVEVIRVPWDFPIQSMDHDGLLLSNGPGDPKACAATIAQVRTAIEHDRPIFGICLGNQLLALAAGGDTYKLPYGHRGHNQPVVEVGTTRAFITSQNHGFAVDTASLQGEWEPLFVNLNDGTNEGLRHTRRPFFSVQFHPEASAGPTDTEFLFDRFIDLMTHRRPR